MPEFFKPEPGLMIWTVITFGVFLLLLSKFALGPILSMLDKRRQTIEENLRKAEEAREEAEKLFAEYKERLEQAKKEAQEIILESKRMGEKLKEEIVLEARKEAENLKEKAIRSIELEREKVLQELREKAAEYSVEIASRILKKSIDASTHRNLIDEALEEVAKRSEN
ncbi:MAG: F0F1 ATP synthase subunit B [Actinobacteria bacterium]|nr:F0F1 ATP synthase subunit B [Actinomycetota bacterium]